MIAIVEDELDTIYEGLEEGEAMNAQKVIQLQRENEDLKKRLEEEQEAERLKALEEFFIPGHVEEETHRIGWWVHGDNRYVVTKAVHPGDAALPFLRLEIEDLKTTYGAGAFKVVRKGKLATLPGQDEFVDPSVSSRIPTSHRTQHMPHATLRCRLMNCYNAPLPGPPTHLREPTERQRRDGIRRRSSTRRT